MKASDAARARARDRSCRTGKSPGESGYSQTSSKQNRGVLRYAAAFACSALLLFAALAAPTTRAHADEGVGQLAIGAVINYAGYSTNWMSVDGNAAYCATPTLATPRSGPYAKEPLRAPSGRTAETAADLWFSYGSPGFQRDLWPSTWYDGSAMTDARYAVCAHILLSDTYSSNGAAALYGCSAAFRSWAQREVLGFDAQGSVINEGATGRRIVMKTGDVPSTFKAFQVTTGASTQAVLSFSYTPLGSIELEKAPAQARIAENNPLYSVEGAVFGVFRDEQCSDQAFSLTTDDQGKASAHDVPTGTYWVKELKAPLHLAKSDDVYRIEVQDRAVARVGGGRVLDQVQSGQLDMLLRKVDADRGEGLPQGDATLGGALFSVAYYPQLSGEPTGNALFTWTFRTDDAGEVHISNADDIGRYLVEGDDLCRDSTGRIALPLGTYVVWEAAAPEGYLLHPETLTVVVQPSGEGEHDCSITFGAAATGEVLIGESVARGGIEITKIDAELGISQAIGKGRSAQGEHGPNDDDAAGDHSADLPYADGPDASESPDVPYVADAPTLEGVGFEIFNASANSVFVDGTWFEPGQVVATAFAQWDEGAAAYVARTAPDALPFGTYEVQEVNPSTGYLLSDVQPRRVEVREEGKLVDVAADGSPLEFSNQVIRNDLNIAKVREEDGKPLQVAFLLTNLATGEAHVLACDRDGKASTESARVPHSRNTNGNDWLVSQGRIRMEDADAQAGTWLGVAEGGMSSPVDDGLGALPYGEYELAELPCDTNEGYELVSTRFLVEHDASQAPALQARVTNHAIDIDEPESAEDAQQGEKTQMAKTGDGLRGPIIALAGTMFVAFAALVFADVQKSRKPRRRRYRYGCRR